MRKIPHLYKSKIVVYVPQKCEPLILLNLMITYVTIKSFLIKNLIRAL